MEFRKSTPNSIIIATLNNLDKNKPFIAIVANGEMPTYSPIINLLKTAQIIIACDGAYNTIKQLDITADYTIGDNDSSLEKPPEYIYIADQNTNDLTKAFNFVINNLEFNNYDIIIFATNGKREDHAIANFALLNEFGKSYPNISMISDFGVFNYLVANTKHTIKCLKNQPVSIFSLESDNLINTNGLIWELKDYIPNSLYGATLNQTKLNYYNIETKKAILVYTSFECK